MLFSAATGQNLLQLLWQCATLKETADRTNTFTFFMMNHPSIHSLRLLILIRVSGVSQTAVDKRQGMPWTSHHWSHRTSTYTDKYCTLTFIPEGNFDFPVHPTSMSVLEETPDTRTRSSLHTEMPSASQVRFKPRTSLKRGKSANHWVTALPLGIFMSWKFCVYFCLLGLFNNLLCLCDVVY